MKVCCVTGHRPNKFPWDYYDCECKLHTDYLEALASKVVELVDCGYTHFVCGGANGVDLDFADIVIGLRDEHCPHITLEVAVPYYAQSENWNREDKERYEKNYLAQTKLHIFNRNIHKVV